MLHPRINKRASWVGSACVVAATGPSLTPAVADAVRALDCRVIAVNDAYVLMPWADVLYACDADWWDAHAGAQGFAGERWSSHDAQHNEKRLVADQWGIELVQGEDAAGFSTDPHRIHYGGNSGFQAVNLALVWGASKVILVGFDQRSVDGKKHFFGDHQDPRLTNEDPGRHYSAWECAAKRMPAGFEIVNCTPGSAMRAFPMGRLEDVLDLVA